MSGSAVAHDVAMALECPHCDRPLDILRHPLRRLSWTRHWWRGVASLVTHPLRVCTTCGSVYTFEGALVAEGAAETDGEMRVRGFRDDMISLRDGFATLVITGEIGAIWTLLNAGSYDMSVTVIMGAIGGAALLPFTYFARKASRAKRELRAMKRARVKGIRSS